MDTITLLATLNENYIHQFQVFLTSVYWNNPKETFEICLLHNGISDSVLDPIHRQCQSFHYIFHPVHVDNNLFSDAPVSKQYPKEMYYRLLAGQFFPKYKRMLYMDPDILIINPLRPLWEKELSDNLFAAAAHTGKTELANNLNRLRLGTDQDYFNSGVLLINLEQCRKKIDPQILFQYTATHSRELVLPDQDLLNALYGNQILPLEDVLWNYDARNYNTYLFSSGGKYNIKWVMEHTSVLHFCGRSKPWKSGYIYRFGLLYQHYEQITNREYSY